MRKLIAMAAGLFALTAVAHAETTEGKITRVDPSAMTVVLDDGKTYKLPQEMDMTVISEGVEVLIAYDVNADGVNQITDMEVLQ